MLLEVYVISRVEQTDSFSRCCRTTQGRTWAATAAGTCHAHTAILQACIRNSLALVLSTIATTSTLHQPQSCADDSPLDVPSEVVRKSLMLPTTSAQHVGRLVVKSSIDSAGAGSGSYMLPTFI